MSDAPHLTVALIVRNESQTICKTLRSIEHIADEIVVFDSSDDDSTKEAASDFHTKWIDAEWTDDFSAARNACWDHATGAWILWLDAGETLTPADAQSLQQFVDSDADAGKVYMAIVAAEGDACGDEGEQVGRLRLTPNLPGLRFQGRVRESIEPAALQLGLSLEGIPQRILSATRENEADWKEARARRNLQLVDIETAARGPAPNLLNCAAAAYHDLGRFEDAARSYARAVDTAARGSVEMLEAYYGLLSTLDVIPESGERQVQLCLQALEIYPVDAQLLCAMGGYLQREQRLDLAARSYETAYRFGQINPMVWHVGRVHQISAVCFGLALQLQGAEEEALRVYREAAEKFPDETLRRHLLNSLIRDGQREEAVALIDTMEVENPEALRSVVRGACLAVEENWLAANAYLKIAFDSGCRDALCLRWYCIVLTRQGDKAEATRVLDEWSESDPGNVELESCRRMLTEPVTAGLRVDSAGASQSPAGSTGVSQSTDS